MTTPPSTDPAEQFADPPCSRSIDDRALRPEHNDLNLVRLLLASLVIYSHSFFAVYGNDHDDLANIMGGPISNYAVDGFFTLSGLLVYRSLLTTKSVKLFLLARLSRLWPGMAAMVIVVAIVGLAFTRSGAIDYFTGRDTVKFLAFNTTFVFPAFTLTGIRCGAELCNINGSLWTLPWEARCYMLLGLLGLCGLARPRTMSWIILPATFAFGIGWELVSTVVNDWLGHGISYQFERMDRLWIAFALGIAAYLLRRHIRLSWWVCLALLAVNIAIQQYLPAAGLHARQILTAYFVLCLGFLGFGNFSMSSKWPDYSYGIYIYAFPVMFVLQRIFAFESPHLLALANLACTVPLAAASWHFVESPALERFKRYRRKVTRAAALAPIHPREPVVGA